MLSCPSANIFIISGATLQFTVVNPELYLQLDFMVFQLIIGGRGGLVVSALDSGASGPGSSPGRGHCGSLHAVYKWVFEMPRGVLGLSFLDSEGLLYLSF